VHSIVVIKYTVRNGCRELELGKYNGAVGTHATDNTFLAVACPTTNWSRYFTS
jgi:hypothetical protein